MKSFQAADPVTDKDNTQLSNYRPAFLDALYPVWVLPIIRSTFQSTIDIYLDFKYA